MPRTNLSDQFNPDQRKQRAPKIIARNTFRFTREGETVIRLHATDIARKLPDGSVILHSGGWRTVTTKDRMNSAISPGYSLVSEKGQWLVCNTSYPYSDANHKRVPFFDGIQVPQCFSKKASQAKGDREAKRQAKLREQIKRFVGKLDKLKELPALSNGDCWYCSMHVAEGKEKGKSWGDSSGNTEHLLSHVQELGLYSLPVVCYACSVQSNGGQSWSRSLSR
jgi:hypothetical protein